MSGKLTIILGCMFSGKTSELIKIIKRYKSIKKKVLTLNFSKDKRYNNGDKLYSHDLVGIDAIQIENLKNVFLDKEIYEIYKESDVICINEGQFFENLVSFCNIAVDNDNKIVYVCGLNGDYQRNKFGEINDLISIAEKIVHLSALCTYCGEDAYFTQRKIDSDDLVLIGGKESYEPVCRSHFLKKKEEIRIFVSK